MTKYILAVMAAGNGSADERGMPKFTATKIARPMPWLIEAAASVGLDYSALAHEVTNHFRNHVMKRHGAGALAITNADFDLIRGIVETPDLAIIGTVRKRATVNAYAKRHVGWTYLYFDEVLNSTHNRVLRSLTLYKMVKALDMGNLERIVAMNGVSDLSRARRVIAAGGHPGGEA